jgi:hypothetical protein
MRHLELTRLMLQDGDPAGQNHCCTHLYSWLESLLFTKYTYTAIKLANQVNQNSTAGYKETNSNLLGLKFRWDVISTWSPQKNSL